LTKDILLFLNFSYITFFDKFKEEKRLVLPYVAMALKNKAIVMELGSYSNILL